MHTPFQILSSVPCVTLNTMNNIVRRPSASVAFLLGILSDPQNGEQYALLKHQTLFELHGVLRREYSSVSPLQEPQIQHKSYIHVNYADETSS